MGVKLAVVLLALCLTSALCEEKSIVTELLLSKYTGFVKLLEQASLLEELDSYAIKHDGLTVLPVTDNYLVNKASPVLLSWLKKEQNAPTLRKVLLNHLIPGRLYPSEFTGNEKTLSGFSIEHHSFRGVEYFGGAPVKKVAALTASDGVAHSVDGLIVPEEVRKELASFLEVKDDEVFGRSFASWSKVARVAFASDSLASESLAAALVTADGPTSTPASTPATSAPPPSDGDAPAPSPAGTPMTAPAPSPLGSAPAPAPSASSILDLILAALERDGNYTSLIPLLNQTSVASILIQQLDKNTTILAPNDFAFSKIPSGTLDALVKAGSVDELLFFHVLNTYTKPLDFLTGVGAISSSPNSFDYETLYTSRTLDVRVEDSVALLGPGNATIVDPELFDYKQVIVLGIDGVMIPSDLLTTPAPPPSSSGYLFVDRMVVVTFLLASLFVILF